jgi:energy-converting hydrogenase Eha subunit G
VAVVAVGVGVDLAAGVGTGLAEAVGLPGFAVGVAAGMAEAVGFMRLLPMVAWPTLVMGGAAMH